MGDRSDKGRSETAPVPEADSETFDHTVYDGGREGSKTLPSASPPAVGRYTLDGLLGAGGMGAVYRGWDPQLDRPVAVKLIHTQRYRSGHDDDQARLVREAQALAALSHPNVVNVFEVGSHEQAVFIAMELVDGPTLRAWTRDEASGWADIVRMYVQAGRGLCAAHERGIVHRDFKPTNVLVGEDGRARVLDFGLATLDERHSSIGDSVDLSGSSASVEALSVDLTAQDTVVGTPAFMAPEQHARQPVTAAADQFSFCVALWVALVGEPPYPGRTLEEIRTSLTARTRGPIPPDLEVPRRVLALVERGLSIDVDARWRSLADLLDRLEAVLGGRRVWPWATGAIVVLAGGLAYGLAPGLTPESGARCVLGEPGSMPWNGAIRAELRAVFEGSDQAGVRASWNDVHTELDHYARGWVEGYALVCEGGVVEAGDQTTFDLRMGCLHQRRDSVRAVLDVLRAEDTEPLLHAVDAIAQLRPVDTCLSAVQGDPATAMPEDAGGRTRASELRARLVAVEALMVSGRREEAEQQARGVVEEATALGFGPVILEAELRHGVALSRLGRPGQAEPLLSRAYWRASDLDYDKAGAEAAIELAWQVGYLQGRHEEGIEWARHYESLSRRSGGNPEPNVAAVLGPIYFDAQRHEEARPYLEQQLTAELQNGGGTHEAAIARMNLGNLLLEMGQFQHADEQLRRSQEIFEGLFDQGHPDLALTLINRATVMNLYHRDPQAAEGLLRRGIDMSIELNGDDHPATGLGLMSLGSLQSIRGHHEEAMATLERSRRAYAGGSSAERLQVGSEIALALHRAGRAEDAERRWLEILTIARDELDPGHIVIAGIRAGLAKLALERGQVDEARRLYEQAIAGIEALPLEALPLRMELGTMLVAHGDPDAGRSIIEAGHTWMRDNHGDDHPMTLDARLSLARALASAGEIAPARVLLEGLLVRGIEPPMSPSLHEEAQAELERLK